MPNAQTVTESYANFLSAIIGQGLSKTICSVRLKIELGDLRHASARALRDTSLFSVLAIEPTSFLTSDMHCLAEVVQRLITR